MGIQSGARVGPAVRLGTRHGASVSVRADECEETADEVGSGSRADGPVVPTAARSGSDWDP